MVVAYQSFSTIYCFSGRYIQTFPRFSLPIFLSSTYLFIKWLHILCQMIKFTGCQKGRISRKSKHRTKLESAIAGTRKVCGDFSGTISQFSSGFLFVFHRAVFSSFFPLLLPYPIFKAIKLCFNERWHACQNKFACSPSSGWNMIVDILRASFNITFQAHSKRIFSRS